MDAAQLLVRVFCRVEILEWRLDPVQTGQVAAGQHIHVGGVSVNFMMFPCYQYRTFTVKQHVERIHTITTDP